MSTSHHSEPVTQQTKAPQLLGPKRVAFQWVTSLLIIVLPFIRVSGESLLRLDFKTLTLHAFGHRFPITDLSLFLLLAIVLTLLFLLITLAFGRAWCGWACPQTSLVDFVEWTARKIGVKVRSGEMQSTSGQKVFLQILYAALGILVGANLVWYFVSPYDFFPALLRGDLHWVASLTWTIAAVTVYLDLAFLRRLFCKEFCPYGRFQTVLVDAGTLTLHYHPDEASRCIKCGACVRNCPTGIDIRNGYQIECINCGRCLDACRVVMSKRNEPGIIRYTFGLEGKGIKALLNLRMALVTVAMVGVLAVLVLATTQREQVSLKIGRNPGLLPRLLENDRVANFYSAYLTNRTEETLMIRLVIGNPAEDLEIAGATQAQELAPKEHRRLDFAIFANKESLAEPRPVDILVVSASDEKLASMNLFLTRPRNSNE